MRYVCGNCGKRSPPGLTATSISPRQKGKRYDSYTLKAGGRGEAVSCECGMNIWVTPRTREMIVVWRDV